MVSKIYSGAVIGLGNIGFLFEMDQKRHGTWSHVSAYSRCADTRLAAVVEVDQDRIQLFRERYPNIPVYTTLKDLFFHETIEIVSLCTPTSTHFQLLHDLLAFSPKAIFCEKPLTEDLDQAKFLLQESQKMGVLLGVNHTRRWDPQFICASQWVYEGRIGKILAVHATYAGHVFNVGTHLFDVVRMITGSDPYLASGRSTDASASDPHVGGWFTLEGDVLCTVNCTGIPKDLVFEVDVIGSEGRVRLVDNGTTLQYMVFKESLSYSGYREAVLESVENPREGDRFLSAIQDFAAVLDGKREQVACTGRDGFLALSMAQALLESARNGGAPRRVQDV